MSRLLTAACLALLASPALAERPADILARLRGTPSTSAGPLGSDFPKQYVDAYRWARPPVVAYPVAGYASCARPTGIVRVGVHAGPVSVGGVFTTGAVGVVTCPAAGFGTTTTVVTTTTTTVTTSGPGVVILAQPAPPAPAPARRVLAAGP